MQYGNIASRTNGAGCIYTEYARTKHIYIHIYIHIYRQFSVYITSVGLAALAPTSAIQPASRSGLPQLLAAVLLPLKMPAHAVKILLTLTATVISVIHTAS